MNLRPWKNLLFEPYRIFFGGGVIYAILAIGIWFTWLHLQDHHIPWIEWKEGPAQIHSHVMIYGVIGYYVFGFILTAFPRFVGEAHPPKVAIVAWFLALSFAQVFLILGTTQHGFWLIPAGFFEGGAYLSLLIYLSLLLGRSKVGTEKFQPFSLLLALGFGTLGDILAYFYYAAHQSFTFYTLSIEFGTYGYLLILVVSITYRIVPFFAERVLPEYQARRGKHTLWLTLALIAARICLVTLFSESPAQYYSSWSINLALLVVLASEWIRWRPQFARKMPMLFVLYLGLFWILVFLGFSGYELVHHLTQHEAAVYPILRTPALHALFVGSFGTLLLGISTRVVRGHGGLPLVADVWMLLSLLLIQIAAIWRVFMPIFFANSSSLWLKNYWAGLLWCFAFGIWAVRYLPVLFRAPVQTNA